ncbi:MAG: TorF family putative porin [Planctomycetota bacterium]
MSIGQKFLTTAIAAGLTATAFSATTASAQEEAPSINNGAVSFSLGADAPTQYVFRGFELEDSGFILQPYAEASFAIYEGIDFYVGTWNSLHSNQTSTTGNNEVWFESDFYAGFAFDLETLEILDNFSVDISYIAYLSPNGGFSDYQEIDLAVGYDDEGLWGFLGEWAEDLSFSPYGLIAFEFEADGAAGDSNNIYIELGAEYSRNIVESEDYPIDLTIPVVVGLSIDEFYADSTGDNEAFGFVSVGANFGVPLSFIPTDFGSWSAGAGVTVFFQNGDVALDDNSSDVLVVGSVGVAMEY